MPCALITIPINTLSISYKNFIGAKTLCVELIIVDKAMMRYETYYIIDNIFVYLYIFTEIFRKNVYLIVI